MKMFEAGVLKSWVGAIFDDFLNAKSLLQFFTASSYNAPKVKVKSILMFLKISQLII